MSTNKSAKKPPSMRWLNDWRNDIAAMKVAEADDVSQYEHRDVLMAQQFNQLRTVDPLTKLRQSQEVMAALTKPYQKLRLRVSEDKARETLKSFIADACWVCGPKVNLRLSGGQVPRSTRVADLERLSKSCSELAKKLTKQLPVGALSLKYLTSRMDAGNQPDFIQNRPRGWSTALLSKEPSLPFLLQCLASDVMEQAGMMQDTIDARRQTGGKLSQQYFAIDSLCIVSKRLSTAVRQAPLFDLVSLVVGVLMNTDPPPVDTLRKRYQVTKKKKTQT